MATPEGKLRNREILEINIWMFYNHQLWVTYFRGLFPRQQKSMFGEGFSMEKFLNMHQGCSFGRDFIRRISRNHLQSNISFQSLNGKKPPYYKICDSWFHASSMTTLWNSSGLIYMHIGNISFNYVLFTWEMILIPLK